jgi:hypothetical protein
MNDTEKQFLEELTTLLKKYNADISIEEHINGYPEISIYGNKDGEYFIITRKYFDGE